MNGILPLFLSLLVERNKHHWIQRGMTSTTFQTILILDASFAAWQTAEYNVALFTKNWEETLAAFNTSMTVSSLRGMFLTLIFTPGIVTLKPSNEWFESLLMAVQSRDSDKVAKIITKEINCSFHPENN